MNKDVTKLVEVEFVMADVSKLTLAPGDVLAIRLYGEDFDHKNTLDSLREHMSKLFPNNKVLLFSMNKEHNIEFDVIKQGETNEPKS